MTLELAPPASDLFIPEPSDAGFDPQTVHTHYFGVTIPETAIGGFLYVRYQPFFRLAQGGACVYRGVDNVHPTDMEHCDYRITMRWPRIKDGIIETANGVRIEFVEVGRCARITYASSNGRVHIDWSRPV